VNTQTVAVQQTDWSFASGFLLGIIHRLLLFPLLLLELRILLLSSHSSMLIANHNIISIQLENASTQECHDPFQLCFCAS